MANRIIPSQIITKTTQGEVTINLNLTITINADGSLKMDAAVAPQRAVEQKKQVYEDEDKQQYIVPEFGSSELLSDFGEDVGG